MSVTSCSLFTVEPWQWHSGDILGRLEAVAEADAGRRDGVGSLSLPPVVQDGHLHSKCAYGEMDDRLRESTET